MGRAVRAAVCSPSEVHALGSAAADRIPHTAQAPCASRARRLEGRGTRTRARPHRLDAICSLCRISSFPHALWRLFRCVRNSLVATANRCKDNISMSPPNKVHHTVHGAHGVYMGPPRAGSSLSPGPPTGSAGIATSLGVPSCSWGTSGPPQGCIGSLGPVTGHVGSAASAMGSAQVTGPAVPTARGENTVQDIHQAVHRQPAQRAGLSRRPDSDHCV